MFEEAESDPIVEKATARKAEEKLRTALLQAQYAFLEKADRALLVVVSGIDGAGKGATINQINEWMDPRHIQTLAFGAPTPAEASRPPMWRYWNALPAKGRTGIVFGSWYAELAREAFRKKPNLVRIETLADEIAAFESMLSREGVQIVKLWYHLSRDAQAARTARLLSDKDTAWQVAPSDRKVAKHFDRLRNAGMAMIDRTQWSYAPWIVIPSADENLRTLRTAETLLAALQHPGPKPRQQPPWTRAAEVKMLAQRAAHAGAALATEPAVEGVEKEDYTAALTRWQARLARAVRKRKFGERSLVLVFEGQDAAGKGGAIRRITHALDARQYDIAQIAAPSTEELARPYLWRFWRRVPERGRIAIFDRSWYGRVLVERVEGFAPEQAWRRAYREINEFEAELNAAGAIVVKFWLAVSADVQLQRFKEREQSPFKHFKITDEDWRNRKQWDAYAAATRDMLARTDTREAPWHVIQADDKRQARLDVLREVVLALEQDKPGRHERTL